MKLLTTKLNQREEIFSEPNTFISEEPQMLLPSSIVERDAKLSRYSVLITQKPSDFSNTVHSATNIENKGSNITAESRKNK